ncbi:hypothetical protein IWW55_000281 [Coemansia sp. RSA 2706]|nr:hypothetical protein LPJ70_003471 [Coemansia sp. RSA 2708]KAJ2308696.1 hypothetical protein IWW55_000281 [Coemansia sp. RSA 2706]KAJ2313834.1 hypothetical protein IWW54_001276 [Coemansia sp. RSA 2705]KAJ2320905.1 hypothetical protein IWW52_001076 [Coemansia sp. RSA 2704]KAJ2329809.1 hypothetical protein IWW51_000365 [Coemansia sp. RSA 2702]KAJ2738637.1 hypothetical protein H4R23_001011 [Coemansia sp. Cherry 401B]
MKFGAAWLALVATLVAADDVNVNTAQPQILSAMSQDLVAALTYLPATYVHNLMLGSAIETNVDSFLALASNMPDEERSKISPLYADFVNQVGDVIPSMTETASSSSSDSTSEESDLSDDKSDSSTDSDESSDASSESDDGSSSDDSSEESTGDLDSESDEDLDSDTSGAGAVRSAGALAAAVVAIAALF